MKYARLIGVFANFLLAFPVLAFLTIARPALAVPIEHRIIFTQTIFVENFGIRNLEGSFFLDDSTFGPGFENMSFPSSVEIALLTDFTVTVTSEIGPWPVGDYTFSLGRTQDGGGYSSIIETGSDGEIIDIRGVLLLSGTISSLLLGRDGTEGEYVEIPQTGQFSAFPGSRGTYSVERVSIPPVPLPAALPLFGTGLAVMGFIGWRRKRIAAETT